MRLRDEGEGVREKGGKEKGRGGELGSDLGPDPWKILWIRIRQNEADPAPQHWLKGTMQQKCNAFDQRKYSFG